jgi:hypothetical protein
MHRSKMHLHSIERVAGEPPHGPCNPFCGRICCDVDPDKVSACEPDDDQDIEQVAMAAMSGAWLRRKVRHPLDGGRHRLTIYFATLD